MVQGIRVAAEARHAGEPDGKGGDEAVAKDETMTDMTRKINAKDRMDPNNIWWVLIAKKSGPTHNGKTN